MSEYGNLSTMHFNFRNIKLMNFIIIVEKGRIDSPGPASSGTASGTVAA